MTSHIGFESGTEWDMIPSHIREGIKRYVEQREPQGDFLMSVFRNDLAEAVGRADEINIRHLREIVQFMWMYAPSRCWGSPEKVAAWLTVEEERTA